MGICVEDSPRKQRAYKTIIIPKGTIDPNQDTTITIPLGLEVNSSLVVKGPSDANACFTVEPYREGMQLKVVPAPPPPAVPQPQSPAAPLPPKDVIHTPVDSFPQEPYIQPQKIVREPPAKAYEAHSPLCPICSRASCKFASTLELSSYRYSRPQVYDPYPYRSKSDMSKRDEILINKLLDEKIDKIIKPLLLALTKSRIEEDEREIGQRYLNSYDRRHQVRRCRSPEDFEEVSGALLKRDSSFTILERRPRRDDYDFDRGRSRNADFDLSQKSSSQLYQRRPNVSFEPCTSKEREHASTNIFRRKSPDRDAFTY